MLKYYVKRSAGEEYQPVSTPPRSDVWIHGDAVTYGDLRQLSELYGIEAYDDEDVETVGGLLAKALGRVPIAGASSVVELPDGRELRLTAEAAAGRRNKIVTVLVEPMKPPAPQAGGEAGPE